jgi:hypothetical protein
MGEGKRVLTTGSHFVVQAASLQSDREVSSKTLRRSGTCLLSEGNKVIASAPNAENTLVISREGLLSDQFLLKETGVGETRKQNLCREHRDRTGDDRLWKCSPPDLAMGRASRCVTDELSVA